jgi:hypothetical protein
VQAAVAPPDGLLRQVCPGRHAQVREQQVVANAEPERRFAHPAHRCEAHAVRQELQEQEPVAARRRLTRGLQLRLPLQRRAGGIADVAAPVLVGLVVDEAHVLAADEEDLALAGTQAA